MKHIGVLFCSLWLVSCTSKLSRSENNPKKISEQRQMVRDELTTEISLKADRSQLDSLRKDIPAEKREANDELAFSLNQTGELKEEPNRIRERFQDLVRKKRHRFDEKVQKLRKKYQKDETARRDDFMKENNKKRNSFTNKKHSPDDTHSFYADLEKDRQEFFSKEREKRQDFDDEIFQQTRDFNEYMKSKNDDFNEQMRIYRQRWFDAKKKDSTTPAGAPMDAENPKLPEPKSGN